MSESREMPGAEGVVILPRVEQALNALTSHCAFYSEYGSQKACFTAIAALRDSLAAPQSEPVAHSCNIEQAIDEYLSGYVMEGDGGYYSPNKDELMLIKDAIMGLLVDPAFMAAQEKT